VIVSASGCATQSYVDESVARLEARLDEQSERINELTETSRQALERATDAGVLAQGKFLYTVVFTDDEITFDTDKSTLSDGVQSRLTKLAGDLKADNQNVYLEIQGHTDSTGSAQYNQHAVQPATRFATRGIRSALPSCAGRGAGPHGNYFIR